MGCVSVCLRFAQRDVAATKVKGFTTEPQRKAKDKWIFSDRQGVFGFIQGTVSIFPTYVSIGRGRPRKVHQADPPTGARKKQIEISARREEIQAA